MKNPAAKPPLRLGYVTLAVDELSAAATYFEKQVHLRPTFADDETVYLTGGPDHHWLVLERANGRTPGLAKLAYEVEGLEELADAKARLEAAGVSTANATDRGIGEALDFADPDGLPIRLFAGMDHDASPPPPAWVNFGELLHVGLSVNDVAASARFYRELLGLKLSDWYEDKGAFLRASNGFHHSLVLLQRGDPRLEHICFHMASFDDLMRARAIMLADGVELKADLIRHAPSNSVGIYAAGVPAEVGIEFCIWHDKIDDNWRPRTLVASPWAYNQWTPPKDSAAR